MVGPVVLLSSRERKALYRAMHAMENDPYGWADEDQCRRLRHELDDGGLWNPCLLVLPFPDNFPDKMDDLFRTLLACKRSDGSLEEYQHDLKMIEDRLLYIHSRRDERKKRGRRWPFAKKEGYYGPNWPEQRKKALERDEYRCIECGMTEPEHQDEFGQGLHVHHGETIGEFRTYEEANDLDNLETYCFDCHINIVHA